jgi:predicted nucleic acid-binding protein
LKQIVLDANVAAKWLLPPPGEPLRDEAIQILRDYNEDKYDILVPDLFWPELANFLWKAVRSGRCTEVEAGEGLDAVREYRFHTFRSVLFLRRAFDIAVRYDRSLYDCLYVALAEESQTELITADERLANALASRYRIRLLSST